MPARFRVYSDYYSPYSPSKYGDPFAGNYAPIKARPSPEEIQKDSMRLEKKLLEEKASTPWESS